MRTMFAWKVAMTTFEKIGVLYEVLKVSIFFCSNKYMARWLNWLERPVHTREVKSSSLFLAIYTEVWKTLLILCLFLIHRIRVSKGGSQLSGCQIAQSLDSLCDLGRKLENLSMPAYSQ